LAASQVVEEAQVLQAPDPAVSEFFFDAVDAEEDFFESVI
jgi:hypothetical protein